MNLRKHLGLGLAAGLLTGLAPVMTTASAAPGSVDADTAPTSDRRSDDPPGTRYRYRATFSAEVTHNLAIDWGGSDNETRKITASITGSIPIVSFTDDDFPELFDLGPTPGTVQVTSATATGVVKTNSGQFVQTCKASSGTASGSPLSSVSRALETTLSPYALMTVPATCTDNQGGKPTPLNYFLPPIYVPVELTSGTVGSDSMAYKLTGYYAMPSQKDLCPGYIEGQTTTCSYGVNGTLRLDFIDKVLPGKKPPKPQKGATVTPGAKRVRIPVTCPEKCTVTIGLTPLKGGPRLTVPRIVSPKAGRSKTYSVPLPAKRRSLVKKAGGVAIKLTYRLTGGTRYSETRKARL